MRPPTSPPDLDVEAWKDSIALIREIAPSSLWPTHFGRFDDLERHLGELERCLDDWLCFAEGLVGQGKSRAEVAEELSAKAEAELFTDRGGPKEAGRYRLAGEVWVFAAGLWRHATRRRQGSEIKTRAGRHSNHLPTQERLTMNDQNVSHSEWEAEAYHRLSDPQFSWGLRVLEDLELIGDEVVLDAGCGTGRLTAELLKRLPRGRVIAVDRSRNMLRAAAGYLSPHFGERVRFVRADLQTLRLEETVDGVFSTATFHWVRDHSLLFRYLYEVVKPGGWLHAQCGGRGNLSRVLRRASSLMAQAPFSRFFSGWPGPWEYADDVTTAERLRAAGYIDVRTSLEPASVRLPNAYGLRDRSNRRTRLLPRRRPPPGYEKAAPLPQSAFAAWA